MLRYVLEFFVSLFGIILLVIIVLSVIIFSILKFFDFETKQPFGGVTLECPHCHNQTRAGFPTCRTCGKELQ